MHILNYSCVKLHLYLRSCACKTSGKTAGQTSGKTAGQTSGKTAGQTSGKTAGRLMERRPADWWKDGRADWWKDGRADWWKDGREDWWKDGRADGWKDIKTDGHDTYIPPKKIILFFFCMFLCFIERHILKHNPRNSPDASNFPVTASNHSGAISGSL